MVNASKGCNIASAIVNVYYRFVPKAEDISEPSPLATPASVALYIGAITDELGQLARANGLDALGYILDMARLEADEVSKCSAERDSWAGSTPSRHSS
jgi:hypothetical protein